MSTEATPSPGALFVDDFHKRRHPRLFLPKYLAEEANRLPIDPLDFEAMRVILDQWTDRAVAGHLDQKETELDGIFLEKIFGQALGYKSIAESAPLYHLQKNPTVPGAGIADGALGHFNSGENRPPAVIIELKGAHTDLDHDKFNGRTAAQQCWDYLNQLPDTQWGIVSNYVAIRLYHKGSPARAYEEFTVLDFKDPARLRQFYFIFQRHGLLGDRAGGKPRTVRLLNRTINQQREVGDKLYHYYSDQRKLLIGELMENRAFSQDDAIAAAQRLLDRIIFIAFCEDRGLLPENLIEDTWRSAAPLARATNPRWRAFMDAFVAIDKGHPALALKTGFNGGLFEENALIDNLDLDDQWSDVFRHIGNYDFREEGEVSVEVLGNIFERSITELEKMRVVGLFGKQAQQALAAMPKSAQRKRFGIYYTPPPFTRLIVELTLGRLIADRVESLPDLADRAKALRKIKVIDPACGSGAFLIAAYERLQDAYEEIARQLRITGHIQQAANLVAEYPDSILIDNLHGVDLSEESVEITKLALWIRSARQNVPLTDLTDNIKHGNSLVTDPAIAPHAFKWQDAFPAVFASGGFDAVIGNPPWERMKVQEREFFSLAAPDIASAVNAAERRKLIAAVEAKRPDLWQRYTAAKSAAETLCAHVRNPDAGYPLTGRGDVNTYMLFAELARKIIAPAGRIGLLVPSGIATDATTRHFFAELMKTKSLAALYDFENKRPWFEDVDGRFKFSVMLMNGPAVPAVVTDFVFFAHIMEDLEDPQRHITLTDKDLKLLNPNTRTCPIFRTRRDADLTKKIYRNVPILHDRGRKSGGNPWGIKFCTMFHQTNDAELFQAADVLAGQGYKLDGNRWIKGKTIYLPLYEAKMTQAYDHRAAGVRIEAGNWMRQGQTEATSLVEHQNPEFVVIPRYWVKEESVNCIVPVRPGVIGFKDISSPTNRRTMIASAIPYSAVTNHFPLMLMDLPVVRQLCLLGNLNSLAYDYTARQKMGGITLNFFILEQIPTLPPDAYDEKCPWDKKVTLEDWVAERVLKLTCTADDMKPLAKAAGFKPGIWKWKHAERARLRAQLDAAYFHLYQITREDVEHILTTFQQIAKQDDDAEGQGETRTLILDAFDALG